VTKLLQTLDEVVTTAQAACAIHMNISSRRRFMKKKKEEVMFNPDVTEQAVENVVAMNTNLKTLIEEICVADEFSILRETLRLYVEELDVH
jgi:hypothetical protein